MTVVPISMPTFVPLQLSASASAQFQNPAYEWWVITLKSTSTAATGTIQIFGCADNPANAVNTGPLLTLDIVGGLFQKGTETPTTSSTVDSNGIQAPFITILWTPSAASTGTIEIVGTYRRQDR
jgi:hypothetical protein